MGGSGAILVPPNDPNHPDYPYYYPYGECQSLGNSITDSSNITKTITVTPSKTNTVTPSFTNTRTNTNTVTPSVGSCFTRDLPVIS